jgi:hypothetical protein
MLNNAKVRSVDREQLVHVASEILRSLKGLDQASQRAGIVLDSNNLDFGQISFVACLSLVFLSNCVFSYGEKVEGSFTLRNPDTVPVVFRFVSPESGVPIGIVPLINEIYAT